MCVPEKEDCKGSTQSAPGTTIWRTLPATPLLELQTHTMQDYIQLVYFSVQVSFRNWCLQRSPANLLPLGNSVPPLDTLALPHSCSMRDFNYLAPGKHQIAISCCVCFTCLASFATWSPPKPFVAVPGCAKHKMTLSEAFQQDLYFGTETPSQECSSPTDFSNNNKKKRIHQKGNIPLADCAEDKHFTKPCFCILRTLQPVTMQEPPLSIIRRSRTSVTILSKIIFIHRYKNCTSDGSDGYNTSSDSKLAREKLCFPLCLMNRKQQRMQ